MKLFNAGALAVPLLVFCSSCGGGDGVTTTLSPTTPQPIGSRLYGVDFGPYLTGNPNFGTVVSNADLKTYLGYVAANFTSCRTYGSTGSLGTVPALAKGVGLKVAAGCWLGTDLNANTQEVNALIANCKAGTVDIAVVGSEVLQRGDLSDTQLIGYITQVKATGVRVTTSDTWNALVAHPRVIAACDEVWANIYPFWEGVSINQDVSQLQGDYSQLLAVAGGKKIVISETGWPSGGSAQQNAVPSPQNEAKYFADFVAWANSHQLPYYYFEAFDEPWKTEPGLVGPHWGIWDSNLTLKPGCANGFKTTTS